MGPTTLATPLGFQVECIDPYEIWRVQTLLTKEEGTIRWLAAIQPGEVVYDIGANIGLYALAARAHGGVVYAFEPHAGNAARLLRNIHLNGFDAMRVLTSALHSTEGFLPFNYHRLNAGSSGSQLGNVNLEAGGTFTPHAVELKHATTIDRLVDDGVILPAARIKIDVDGNEPHILRGMQKLLAGPSVTSLQVEIHPATDAVIVALLLEAGLVLRERHYTSNGHAAMAQGAAPTAIPHNAIFERLA